MKNKIKFVIFLIFFSIIFLVNLNSGYAWLSGFVYRRAINITNSGLIASTNYQVVITLDTATLISQGKMRSDCGDIRVTYYNSTDGTETQISQWVWTNQTNYTSLSYSWWILGCNTPNTRITVKVPYIPASSNATIYIYYGNSTVTSVSSLTDILSDNNATMSAQLPQAIAYHRCASIKDAIYCFGGKNSSGFVDTIYKYNITSNTITLMSARLPLAYSDMSCAPYQDAIYCFGGWNNSYLDIIVKYNTTTDTLTTLSTKLPTARLGLGCVPIGNYIYCLGGGISGGASSEIDKFNPADNTITNLTVTLPSGRGWWHCAPYQDAIYCFGGSDGTNRLSQIVRYNITSNAVTTANATLPSSRNDMPCAPLGDAIYCFGGYNGSYLKDILKYNPSKDTITTMSSTIMNGDAFFSCVPLGDAIYCLGGYNGSSTLNQIFRYGKKYTSPEPTTNIGNEEKLNFPPTITIYQPSNTTYFYSNNFLFNFSVSDDKSVTFWIKIFLDGSLIYENKSYQNSTLVVLTQNLIIPKSYNLTIWANDTDTSSPLTSSLTAIFTITDYQIQQIIYNQNVYETTQQTFSEVIRYNPDLILNVSANLLWNSTSYSTLQTQNATHFTLTSQFYIPLVQTNNTVVNFYFTNQIIYANGTTATINSQTNQQNILVAYLLNSISFANYSTFSNINFTKYLQTNFNISCLVSNQISLGIYVNSTDYKNASFNCNGNNIYSISNINIANDGIYTITPYLRIDFQGNTKILNGTSANFYFDNTPPTFNFTQFISIYGFSLTNMTNATIYANDINYAKCNITLNSNSTINAILKGNSTTIYALWNDGINNLTISCTDLVGNQNQTSSYYDVRFKKLILWEETKNRILQNFTGFTTLALKNENTGDILDLKSLANPIIYFVEPRSSNFTKLRLEFSFSDATDTINRIIHSDLIPSETRICTYESSTTYYTLYILSSQQTDEVGIVNTISNCYVGAGRTEYTIQNSYGLLIYTIRQNYYLYRILSETEKVYLALVDGSIAQYINLDMLQYFSTKPTISFSREHFIVSKIADKTLVINYLRTDNANTYAIVRIYNNNNLLATINADNPNDFKMYFDFSTINITSNIFYIEIETNNGKFGRYFDVSGKVGLIPEELALVLAFGFFIFGFTLSMRLGIGILGFLTALISIIICALSIQTPTITLAEGIFIIVMIFSLLTITQEAKRVV